MSEIARTVTDGDHQPPPTTETGIPFLFISHIVKGRLDITGCKWVSHDYFASLSPSRRPERGDVLYTAVGSYGVPCLVDTDEPFCFQRHIAIIKSDNSRVTSRYLMWALSSSEVFDQATSLATGSAQLTVPLQGIRNYASLSHLYLRSGASSPTSTACNRRWTRSSGRRRRAPPNSTRCCPPCSTAPSMASCKRRLCRPRMIQCPETTHTTCISRLICETLVHFGWRTDSKARRQ